MEDQPQEAHGHTRAEGLDAGGGALRGVRRELRQRVLPAAPPAQLPQARHQ
ncbi:hypothetical protein JYU34_007912 [Plutella xylostella]|uniref:Uncharacterized protein n=1 Tax=Plutella xylostella TaxID=51655 RepID=A0ABQ7QNB8_PLUXY|nr:hypothetical protein JYU34_007912 [Plutella xylostella]